MTGLQALEWILVECGYTRGDAKHFTKVLDRLRLCAKGSDDLAGALLRWRMKAVEDNLKLRGFPICERPVLPDCPTLFD